MAITPDVRIPASNADIRAAVTVRMVFGTPAGHVLVYRRLMADRSPTGE